MIIILANQDPTMPDHAATSPEPPALKTPTPLTPSRLAAVVEARYILDVRRR
jgi:hypothetical protein